MRIREVGKILMLLPLLLLSLSCNEVAPTQGPDSGASKGHLMAKLEYPLAMGNYWVYHELTYRVLVDSAGGVTRQDSGLSDFTTFIVDDSIRDSRGVWWTISAAHPHSRSPYVQYMRCDDSVFVRFLPESLNLNNMAGRTVQYIPPPLFGTISFSSFEFGTLGPYTKTVSLVRNAIVTSAGSFTDCAFYLGTVLRDNEAIDVAELVKPGIGMIERSELLRYVGSFPQVGYLFTRTLVDYHLNEEPQKHSWHDVIH